MKKLMLSLIFMALILGISDVSFSEVCDNCYTWYAGTCDNFNSECDCDPIGPGDCSSERTKTWSAGTPLSCKYIAGDDGQDCALDENVNCYWSQSCRQYDTNLQSMCFYGSCQYNPIYGCQECTPTGAATPHWYTNYKCE